MLGRGRPNKYKRTDIADDVPSEVGDWETVVVLPAQPKGERVSSEDISYYRERARVERERAKESSSADIAEIHEELARLYDALVEHESLRPTLHIVTRRVAWPSTSWYRARTLSLLALLPSALFHQQSQVDLTLIGHFP
jgi:hypothetical protein